MDRQQVRSRNTFTGEPGSATRELPQQPAERFRSKDNTKFEFNVAKANDILDKAGWKKGADGIREKGGVKKLKFVYQTSINAAAPKKLRRS